MTFKRLIKTVVPNSMHLPLLYTYFKITGRLDDEISLISDHVRNCRRAIDVGANIGKYSYALSKYFDCVDAFEPNIECSKMLRAYASKKNNVTVHNVGLSNNTGDVTLYVPFLKGKAGLDVGLASITDPGGDCKRLTISLQRLDDFNFKNVDFIKIDVEGHEYEVLEGAIETIRREKPILLVEIEQRHLKGRSINNIFHFITSFGYTGGYFKKKIFYSIETFSYERHQKPYLNNFFSNQYINNFIFAPIAQDVVNRSELS